MVCGAGIVDDWYDVGESCGYWCKSSKRKEAARKGAARKGATRMWRLDERLSVVILVCEGEDG